MAKRVLYELVDDIDGKPADETVRFALDGVQYEIDLSTKNAARLRSAIAPFVAAGSRVGHGRVTASGHGRTRQSSGSDRDRNRAIRDWAATRGIEIAGRGRIKRDVLDSYLAATGRRR